MIRNGHFQDLVLQQRLANGFALRRQDFFNVPLPFKVREPAQVVGNEVMLAAAVALDDDNTLLVGNLGNQLGDSSRAKFAKERQ